MTRRSVDWSLCLALVLLLVLVAARLNPSSDQAVHSGPFRVIDGDSLAVDSERMRLEGIDAPELTQICERGGRDWMCGQEARALLRQLLPAANSSCAGNRRDRYERLLVRCNGGGREINAEMVRRGMAVAYGDYEDEEGEAKAQKRGLWAGEFERPADYRDAERGYYGWLGFFWKVWN